MTFGSGLKGTAAPIVLGLVWIFLLTVGFSRLMTYSNTPGDVGKTGNWPTKSALERNSTGPTLIVFSHPKCPCTRATEADLERLVTQTKGYPVKIYVDLFFPGDEGAQWADTALKRKFEKIPGVKIFLDKDGAEAEKFGALTSGQTLLYDRFGALLFKGGITPARGHEGDNLGMAALVTLVRGGKTETTQSKVFGCSLRKPASMAWKVE